MIEVSRVSENNKPTRFNLLYQIQLVDRSSYIVCEVMLQQNQIYLVITQTHQTDDSVNEFESLKHSND